jgi:hypothetical protein
MIDATRAVLRTEPLRNAAERAGMLQDDGVVAVIALVENDAIALAEQQIG